MEPASSAPISLGIREGGRCTPPSRALFEGPEPGSLKWFPKMLVLVQPCGVGSGAVFQAVWGLYGGGISGIEKWAPVGNPLASRPSL